MIIRDTQVIFDRDVAKLYGVETREINQALRNNPKKFPPGYVIELNNREKDELIKNFDRFKIREAAMKRFMAAKERKRQRMAELEALLRQDYVARTSEEPKFVNVW